MRRLRRPFVAGLAVGSMLASTIVALTQAETGALVPVRAAPVSAVVVVSN